MWLFYLFCYCFPWERVIYYLLETSVILLCYCYFLVLSALWFSSLALNVGHLVLFLLFLNVLWLLLPLFCWSSPHFFKLLHFPFSTFPFTVFFLSPFSPLFPFFPCLFFRRSAEISQSEVSGGTLPPPPPVTQLNIEQFTQEIRSISYKIRKIKQYNMKSKYKLRKLSHFFTDFI